MSNLVYLSEESWSHGLEYENYYLLNCTHALQQKSTFFCNEWERLGIKWFFFEIVLELVLPRVPKDTVTLQRMGD